ncbi:MAG: tRNA-dihydrouridine synthase family protein [Nannocystaceae bacterium]|nr:tRNA-dihydrouridine synthase family protein [Nannocystaceae bacterium]
MTSDFEAAWREREIVARRPDERGLFVALAPMDGVTDWVYRQLLTDLHGGDSGISLCVSEFVRVTHRQVVDRVLLRHCPELTQGGKTRAGVPVFVQILGGDAEPMAATARRAAELGAPGIDINFGCPAKTVNRHDGGATILKCPARVESLTAAVRKAVPEGVAVTVKIRLGWSDAAAVEDIARAAERGGADWLTIHARTRLQLYRPPVDWPALGRARAAISIPVVANGDVDSIPALRACAQASGCAAFMVGRGAMGRPRLFRQLRGHPDPEFDLAWLGELLRQYVVRLTDSGAPPRAALGRLKQWLRLGAPALPELRDLFDATKRICDLDAALDLLSGLPAAPLAKPAVVSPP